MVKQIGKLAIEVLEKQMTNRTALEGQAKVGQFFAEQACLINLSQ